MSFTPEDYAYICNVLLTYGLQQPPQADTREDTQGWNENAQADADLALATRDYTTLMDVVSASPSPRPTRTSSPQMPKLFPSPNFAALPSLIEITPGEVEYSDATLPSYGPFTPEGTFYPESPGIYGVADAQTTTVEPSRDLSLIHSSPLLSQAQAQLRLHDRSPTSPNPVIQIEQASPDDHYIPDPPSGENTPKDYCQWLNCGQLIYTDRRSVSEHLRSVHRLDLRKKAPPIACIWPGCQSGIMNADSLARHVSSAMGHLAGTVHGCEYCMQRGFFRRDILDRHLKDCPLNPRSVKFLNSSTLCETDLGGGLIMCVFEEPANRAKAVYYRQDAIQRARD